MKTVADTKREQEAQFIEWLVATDACALAGIVKGHRCKGPREAVAGATGGHVLLCARAADELQDGDAGVFTSELFETLACTALARCEIAKLEAVLAPARGAA